MKELVQKYLTTEAVFAGTGVIWFLLSSFLPAIPQQMPLGIPVPGFENLTISPGLLVGVAVVPVILKLAIPGRTAFIATSTPSTAQADATTDAKEAGK